MEAYSDIDSDTDTGYNIGENEDMDIARTQKK